MSDTKNNITATTNITEPDSVWYLPIGNSRIDALTDSYCMKIHPTEKRYKMILPNGSCLTLHLYELYQKKYLYTDDIIKIYPDMHIEITRQSSYSRHFFKNIEEVSDYFQTTVQMIQMLEKFKKTREINSVDV